jgi:uncharacterized protein (DUF2235 family)
MKHLVYLIDGTWLFAGDSSASHTYSNIYMINELLELNDTSAETNPQIIHYVRGIGATRSLSKYTSGGFGYGIRENIEDIYTNICANYSEGDCIYIFGFSRGAVVARAVSGMISCGLLEPDRIQHIEYVWNTYTLEAIRKTRALTNSEEISLEESKGAVSVHRKKFDVPVEFLGVFDTVVGGRNITKRLQQLDLEKGVVSNVVKNTVHIVAMDERRSFFAPVPFTGISPDSIFPNSATLEQIWMPGIHGDIGGGYPNNRLADYSLMTMLDRVILHTSLNFKLAEFASRTFRTGIDYTIRSEFTGGWKIPLLFSGKRPRSPFGGSENPSIPEAVHPIASTLTKFNGTIRNKRKQTLYRNALIGKIAESTSFRSDQVKSFI